MRPCWHKGQCQSSASVIHSLLFYYNQHTHHPEIQTWLFQNLWHFNCQNTSSVHFCQAESVSISTRDVSALENGQLAGLRLWTLEMVLTVVKLGTEVLGDQSRRTWAGCTWQLKPWNRTEVLMLPKPVSLLRAFITSHHCKTAPSSSPLSKYT